MKYFWAVLAIIVEILVYGGLVSEIGLRGALRGFVSILMCALFVATWRAITKKKGPAEEDGKEAGEGKE